MLMFMNSLDRSMNAMTDTFYSSPRSSGSSGGSFSGGGGFSGGGFGGGGGAVGNINDFIFQFCIVILYNDQNFFNHGISFVNFRHGLERRIILRSMYMVLLPKQRAPPCSSCTVISLSTDKKIL